MEINFSNVTHYKYYNTEIEQKVLANLNLQIPKNKISALVGSEEKSLIGKMICALEMPHVGNVKIGKYNLEHKKYIKKINELRFVVGYVFNSPEDYLIHDTVKQEVEYGMKHFKYKLNKLAEHQKDALKIVGLDESYNLRNPLELSLTEQKKVMLASILAYNPKVIVLDEFEKGLNYQERKNLIRTLKMLKDKYNRTIIVISNDLDFLINFVDFYFVIKNGNVSFNCTKEDFFNKGIEEHFQLPQIVDFIHKARKKGSKLINYYEINELIKGVYRDVK